MSLIPSESEALAAWAARVRANRDQAERLREPFEAPDFYAPVASMFKADPRRTNESALEILRFLARPGERWLDIGAGGGRYALPLALLVKEIVAIEPSEAMLTILREGMAEHGISNIDVREERWPPASAVQGDVAFIAHVGYDIEEIGPFLDAMEASAPRCIAVLQAESPATAAAPAWPLVHDEERNLLPALPEFLALQLARGRLCEVQLTDRPANRYPDPDFVKNFLRQQLFIAPGGAKDQRLESVFESLATNSEGGPALSRLSIPIGVVSWASPDPAS